MARRRRVVREVGEVPAELTDPDHEIWADAVAVEVLAAELGIGYREPEPSMLRDPFFERFRVFRRAWAEVNGFTDDGRRLDLGALRDAGVYASGRGPRWRLLPTGEVRPLRP